MISTTKPKSNTHPWCIIRQLPNMQRLVVARFRSRNDADAYRLILQQLLPTVDHVIIFDLNLPETYA